jgi:hypothetical protein
MTLSEYKKLTGLYGTPALTAYRKGIDPQVYIDGRIPKKANEYTIGDIEFLLNIPKSTLLSMRKYGELPEPARRIINERGKWNMLWTEEQLYYIKPRTKKEKKRTITGVAAEFILFNSGRSYLL